MILEVGDQSKCSRGSEEMAIIHACKFPCYVSRISPAKNYPKDDPRYLWVEDDHDLYLYIIDPPKPLFQIESIYKTLAFGEGRQKILVHCNQGQSRSVALAILLWSFYGDKHDSFEEAKKDFEDTHPDYPVTPNRGIQEFLTTNWNNINNHDIPTIRESSKNLEANEKTPTRYCKQK